MPKTLSSRAVIALTGPDARPFLQGLITNDTAKITPDRPAYGALLTPQGKILFDFLVQDGAVTGEDGLLIDCTKNARDSLLKRISLYKLRAQITLTPRDDLFVVQDGADDPRLAALGPRSVQATGGEDGDAAYLDHRLALGVPEGADFGSGEMFALDAGLDELNGVAFDKGCYIGQELTARMKHRGTDRKRLLPVQTLDGSELPLAPVTSGETELGPVMNRYGGHGFALIRLDRLKDSQEPLTAGGISVAVAKPAWLFT
jgi:folate-binding protein YgfZ